MTTTRFHLLKIAIYTALIGLAFARGALAQDLRRIEAHPHRIIVKYREGVSEQSAAALGADTGTRRVKKLPRGRIAVVETTGANTVASAIAELERRPEVEFAEPDWFVRAERTPNDPQLASQWALHNASDTDIDAPQAWDLRTGAESVVVGVVDTGVDYTHPDLAANMWRNPRELPNGLDDDANGYVDDIHGINCINGSGNPMDDNGYSHGTHVAGTIGAVGNNAQGVTGVAWNARIMALKFLGADGGGYTSDAIECIAYAVNMSRRYGVNVRVLNNSWGGTGYSRALQDVITSTQPAGMVFVSAAGNAASNNDVAPFYPANYVGSNLITVAATASDGRLASFSNYGPATVHIAAPGTSILSTMRAGGFGYLSGTSMAAPHVSGVAALVAAFAPGQTPEWVRSALVTPSPRNTSPALVPYVSGGVVLRARHALEAAGGGDDDEPIEVVTPVAGKSLTVSDRLAEPGKRSFSVSVSDDALTADSLERVLSEGAAIRLSNPRSGEGTPIELEASGWVMTRRGLRYDGEQPCRVDLAKGRLSAKCSGEAVGLSLDESQQGALRVDLALGEELQFCSVFGGSISKDYGIGYGRNRGSGSFKARKAPAPESCD